MQLTAVVFGISSISWVLVDTAILSLPKTSVNCGDQAQLICISNGCNNGYIFTRGGFTIYNFGGPLPGIDSARYSATLQSDQQVQLTITNIQFSDAVMSYGCTCGFDTNAANHTLSYECKASTSSARIMSDKKLRLTVDKLYPLPSGISTALTKPTSQLPGTHTCESSPTLALHYSCTWESTASLPDGNHSYTITVTAGTQAAEVSGHFRIVTPTSPTISNLSTISNNRQIVRGVQDTPLTIQCVSKGGIPAPTLAWYRGNTSASPLAQSTTTDSVQQSDDTYTVTLTHRFTPSRTDDMTLFLCQASYPRITTEASHDPYPASVFLYLDLKPNITTVSQTSEAVSGGNITLRCISTNGRPAPTITWFYRGQTFSPTNTQSLEQTSETYTVESVLQRAVSAEDNGQEAMCKMSHTSLPGPLSATTKVDVKFGPRPDTATISGNKTIQATGDNKLLLNCTSGSSNPASNITWYNGSDVIPNTEGYTRWPGDNNGVVTSNILTITPTRYMDGNRITCRNNNGYGNGSLYVDLDIIYPCLIKTLPNVTVIEGQPNFTLTCSASSKPPANFTWYKGTKVLASGVGSVISNRFSYVIPRVDRTMGGSYTCNASNTVGSPDSKDAYLFVEYPPTVTVSATTSSPYTVTCTAEGYPTYYTYQDWVQIWPGYGPVATIPFNGTTLTLTNDTYERSGVFMCGASNGVAVYGTDQKYMHGNETILIKVPPVMVEPRPGVANILVAGRIGQDASTEIKYWSNVNNSAVRCDKLARLSFPGCNVTETKTEVTLPVYNHTVKETGTLATIRIPIRSVEDFTDYDIVVTNRKGKSVQGITIVPEGPPATPKVTDIVVVVTPGQVILTVIPGFHGGFNQTLVVQISTDLTTWFNNTSVNIGLDTRPREVTLANLKGNALHYMQMFSYNSVGRSIGSSEILNFTNADAAVPVSPPHAALIGGTVGAFCALIVVTGLVVVVLRNRKVGLLFSKAKDKRCLANDQDNSDGVVECAMYISAENVLPGPSVRDVYSTVQKKRPPKLAGNEHNVVAEKTKDLYASLIKESGGNKTRKAGNPVKGSRHVPDLSETEFGNYPTSNRHPIPKKNVNDDGLIYVDLEFDNNASYDVIHGLDDVTIYEEIDFTRTAEPLPDSDGESTDTK